eukprot:3295314-Alexandrium_andersonii.AAC.1
MATWLVGPLVPATLPALILLRFCAVPTKRMPAEGCTLLARVRAVVCECILGRSARVTTRCTGRAGE